MSILIMGMEMPKNCNECKFGTWSNLHQTECCKRHDFDPCFEDHSREYMEKRADFCPLVEVKEPHGRLIDAYALDTRVRQAGGMGNVEEECTEDFNDGVLFVLDYFVKKAPTVIPREDGETHDDT